MPPFLHRRTFLSQSASGFGGVALAWLLGRDGLLANPHFIPKAKRVIHIFSPGGVSHVDTFDYKPELERLDGQPLTGRGKLDPFFGKPGNLRKSFYGFARHGQSGQWVSDLLPHLSQRVDDLAIVRSMVTNSPSHQPACFQMNTGFTMNGFPCMGAWLSYGLGTENEELPAFVVLPDPRGLVNGATNNWSQGFLPAQHQGVAFQTGSGSPVPNLQTPDTIQPDRRQLGLAALNRLNQRFADQHPGDESLSARIRAYELAARMQVSIPETVDFSQESPETLQSYGIDHPIIGPSARNFLLARRLVERGVRFVQIYNGAGLGSPRVNWDAHEDLRQNHDAQALLLDQPCAALLKDLKQRGLMDETLVFWSTEFGRTPYTEARGPGKGRDHHPDAFTAWIAGAGVKAGIAYGATDDVGFQVTEKPVTVYDFHATLLHLLGIDHEKLTYYHNGVERRLTDVHGRVVRGLLP